MTPSSRAVGSAQARGSLRARFIRNLSHLAAGKAASAGIGVVSLALMARLLGPAAFGVVAMIESYCRLIDQLLRIETWQAMLRYGSEPVLACDTTRLASLIKLCITIDLIGALTVSSVAMTAVPLAARLLGWDAEAQGLVRLYALALFFGVSSTPVGILRLYDRFAQIAWIDPILALARAAGLVAIVAGGGGIRAVVLLLVALVIAERLAMTLLAWRVLRAERVSGILRASLTGWREAFGGIGTFLLSTNAAVLLRKATQETDTLVVGYFVGPAGAGIYQFARRTMLMVAKTAQMLQQVVAPDLAKLWASGAHGRFRRVVNRIERATIAVATVALIVLAIAGSTAIALVGGPDFAPAYFPMIGYAVAVSLFLAGTTMRSALTVSGGATEVLRASVVATLVYLTALVPSIRALGTTGASVAQIMFSATALAVTVRSFRSRIGQGP